MFYALRFKPLTPNQSLEEYPLHLRPQPRPAPTLHLCPPVLAPLATSSDATSGLERRPKFRRHPGLRPGLLIENGSTFRSHALGRAVQMTTSRQIRASGARRQRDPDAPGGLGSSRGSLPDGFEESAPICRHFHFA